MQSTKSVNGDKKKTLAGCADKCLVNLNPIAVISDRWRAIYNGKTSVDDKMLRACNRIFQFFTLDDGTRFNICLDDSIG